MRRTQLRRLAYGRAANRSISFRRLFTTAALQRSALIIAELHYTERSTYTVAVTAVQLPLRSTLDYAVLRGLWLNM